MTRGQVRTYPQPAVTNDTAPWCAPVAAGPLVKRMQMLVGLNALKTCPACSADVHRCDVLEGDVFTHCCEVVFECGATVRLMRDATLHVVDGCKGSVAGALQHYIPGAKAHAA